MSQSQLALALRTGESTSLISFANELANGSHERIGGGLCSRGCVRLTSDRAVGCRWLFGWRCGLLHCGYRLLRCFTRRLQVFAVGKVAEEALARWETIECAGYIRHPAQGGESRFRSQFRSQVAARL